MKPTPQKARLYLLLGFFLLVLPSINSFYHGSTGKLLVAESSMNNPLFGQSVIYITHHNLFGATGYIINKPFTPSRSVAGTPLFQGGPVGRGGEPKYLSVTGRDIAYEGYTGWGPLQLNNEMWFGHWHVIDADPEILQARPTQMWHRAIQKVLIRDGARGEGVL